MTFLEAKMAEFDKKQVPYNVWKPETWEILDIKSFLTTALQDLARELVGAVPESNGYPLPEDYFHDSTKAECQQDGWNNCRQALISKITVLGIEV